MWLKKGLERVTLFWVTQRKAGGQSERVRVMTSEAEFRSQKSQGVDSPFQFPKNECSLADLFKTPDLKKINV